MNSETTRKTISAARSRSAARWFNYGNIISMIIPMPLGVFWFGMSMLVYAMNRHHPNERVGYYTQHAAYRFYGVLGFIVLPATGFGAELKPWLITWAISALILIPWSFLDLRRIAKEDWQDVEYETEKH